MPDGLGSGGRKLWAAIADDHDLDAGQLVQLEEACRAKDRCDFLDRLIQAGEDGWQDHLKQANATANLMKQLLAALRLPDEHGKRPQYRGPRGAQRPTVAGGAKVSSLDRARQRSTG